MTSSSKTARLLAIGILVFAMAGCANIKQELGLGKKSPDEFRVVSRAPLAIPPEFGLRPPEPGAPRPQTGTPTDQARNALFGTSAGGEASYGSQTAAFPVEQEIVSPGEQLLLNRAGAQNADPNIRTLVNQETNQKIEEDRSLVDVLVFWREKPAGDVVDPQKEADRLRANAALGKPVTEGETPTIQRRKPALLEGIL